MPDLYDLFTQYFWLLGLLFTAYNTLAYRSGRQRLTQAHPDQAQRYVQWPYGFMIESGVVWLTMGIGMVIGHVPSVFAYFDPATGNPYIIAWHVVLVSTYVLGCLWVFVGGGAQFIVDHPGILFITLDTKKAVRIQLGLGLLGIVVIETVLWASRT